jgi:phosphoglycolate phosphatase-like HAD superfamily hydrolase
MNVNAVVFDMDGVILKTNFVKHDAMMSLFSAHHKRQAFVSEMILSNGGVPRREKFARIHRALFGTEPNAEQLADYLCGYADALGHQICEASMVEGVEDYIRLSEAALYVCSSAPVSELREQIAVRFMSEFFVDIYGGERPKAEALKAISSRHPRGTVVFFGDAASDHDAACDAGVAFVGVVCERDNFQSLPVVRIQDFKDRDIVNRAVRASLEQQAPTCSQPDPERWAWSRRLRQPCRH